MRLSFFCAAVPLRHSVALSVLIMIFTTLSTNAEILGLNSRTFRLEADSTAATIALLGRWPSGRVFRDEAFAIRVTGFLEFNSTSASATPTRTFLFDNSTRYELTQLTEMVNGTSVFREYFRNRILPFPGLNVSLDLEAGIVNETYTTILAGQPIEVRENALKFSIICRNFPFLLDSRKFRFLLSNEFYVPFFSGIPFSVPVFSDDGLVLNYNITTNNIFATLALQQFASLDGVLRTYVPVEQFPRRTETAWIVDMGFEFPVFRNEFIYDPDMTVLLLSPDPGPDNTLGAPSDGASATPGQQQIRNLDAGFQPWIAAVVVVAVIVLGASVAAVIVIVKRRKYEREKAGMQAAFVRDSSPTPSKVHREAVDTRQPQAATATAPQQPPGWQRASKPALDS